MIFKTLFFREVSKISSCAAHPYQLFEFTRLAMGLQPGFAEAVLQIETGACVVGTAGLDGQSHELGLPQWQLVMLMPPQLCT